MLAEMSFGQSIVIELIKAIITAVFVTVGAGMVVHRYQARREAAALERERSLDEAASARAIRADFVRRTSELAGSFYFLAQEFWRRSQDPDRWGAPVPATFDAQYRAWASSAEVLENELRMEFGWTGQPAVLWHQVRDLLTVRYFDLRDGATDGLLRANARGEALHSGLTVDELRSPARVLATYRSAMEQLARQLNGNHDGHASTA